MSQRRASKAHITKEQKLQLQHCFVLPTAKQIREYVKEYSEEVVSLVYDTKSATVLRILKPNSVEVYSLHSNGRITTEKTKIGKLIDVFLEDYLDNEQVHVDAVSLFRILSEFPRPKCPKDAYKVAAYERIDAAIVNYIEAYNEEKKPSVQMLLAKRYLLDSIGSHAVLLSLDDDTSLVLEEKETPFEFLSSTKSSEIVRVGTELHRAARMYVENYGETVDEETIEDETLTK
jgi:hypothetical protein